jgi:predicted Fe-Mo cluster-binding NifX family protein
MDDPSAPAGIAIVQQLLDEMLEAVAIQAAGPTHIKDFAAAGAEGDSCIDSSKAHARRSAITALREGVDAR